MHEHLELVDQLADAIKKAISLSEQPQLTVKVETEKIETTKPGDLCRTYEPGKGRTFTVRVNGGASGEEPKG